MPSLIWTPEITDRLIELWGNGVSSDRLSAKQIAVNLNLEFKLDISRNSVIGKSGRLGLPQRKRQPDKKERALKGHTPPTGTQRAGKPPSGATNKIEAVDLPLNKAGNTACFFMDAKQNECRWPIGDPSDLDTFLFCGGPVVKGFSYCAGHGRMAYRAGT